MGLGKTFVGAEKMYLLNNSVNVVICQKSKIDDWVQHFKEYYPSDRVMNLTKKKGEKFGNTPDHCFIFNDSVVGVKTPPELDRQWYIDLAKKRLKQFGVVA